MSKKERIGVVISTKAKKTINVAIVRRYPHLKYRKVILKTKNYMAHDENNICKLGNLVLIQECAPISKNKTWILKKII